MASNRSSKAKRASAAEPTELHTLTHTNNAAAGPVAGDEPIDDASARAADRAALEQAMVLQRNARLARSPGATGPIGRAVLLIAVLALVGLIAVWMLFAY